eukprot:TRINITY_DN6425_c0_g1_i2.p2 TRINITY_DN6425_c0_g1~~TRINITY_DN6425_c0_g1_i2.p2  ORF type:complete len:345 (+),score=63.15 TRINITY_DN6425_c0_g1_i2:1184-2218(+)
MNKVMLGTLGLVEQNHILGCLLQDLVPESSRAQLSGMLQGALAGEQIPSSKFTFSLQHCDLSNDKPLNEEQVPMMLNCSRRVDKVGKLTGATFFGCDLTEIEKSAKQAELRKTRFMGVVSHELRSPLHGILGLVDSLLKTEVHTDRAKRLGFIKSCATRLLDLVVNIIDATAMLSKPQNKKVQELNLVPVQLKQLAEEVVALVQHSLDKRGQQLVKSNMEIVNLVADDLPIIQGDSDRIMQIIFNLVVNACKFTEQGKITLESRTETQWVGIAVSDTGIGIPRESLERIFVAFEQGDDSGARCQQGIGLGLSIAKEMVELHGGKISVHSAVGVGSTFTVRFPRA